MFERNFLFCKKISLIAKLVLYSREPRFARHPLEISSFLGKLYNKHLYYNFAQSIICLHLTVASRCSAPFRHLVKSIPNVPVNSKPTSSIYILILSVCQSDSNFCQKIDFLQARWHTGAPTESFLGSLCSVRNAFSCAAGASGARSEIFFMNQFFFAKMFYLF